MKKMKAFVKYPGSKWGLAGWIIGYFPEHHSYLEPFFGSGAVLFNKPRSHIETVNDLDGNVVNLFEWIKHDPERLAHEIYYTPYARQAYEEAFSSMPEDGLQQAVNFCIRLNMGHGFRTNGEKVGWKNDVQGREGAYAVKYWRDLPGKIKEATERLREVQIECMPATELIKRFNYPDVFMYIDPPYLWKTRTAKQYRHEMTDADHEQLLRELLTTQAMIMISGYETDMYNDILKGWHKEQFRSHAEYGGSRIETVWMNYERQFTIQEFQQQKLF